MTRWWAASGTLSRYYADGTVKDAVQVPATAVVGSEYQRYVVADTIADAVDAIDNHDAERCPAEQRR